MGRAKYGSYSARRALLPPRRQIRVCWVEERKRGRQQAGDAAGIRPRLLGSGGLATVRRRSGQLPLWIMWTARSTNRRVRGAMADRETASRRQDQPSAPRVASDQDAFSILSRAAAEIAQNAPSWCHAALAAWTAE